MRDQWDERYQPPLNDGITLDPWQKLAVYFLHWCSTKFGYALFGDEMGYGKVHCHRLLSLMVPRRW